MSKVWGVLKAIGVFVLSIAGLLLYFLVRKENNLPDTSDLDKEKDRIDSDIAMANAERDRISDNISNIDDDISRVDDELDNIAVSGSDVTSAVNYLRDFIGRRQ